MHSRFGALSRAVQPDSAGLVTAKTKRPGACARPVNLKLVAGVRFELTTFGL